MTDAWKTRTKLVHEGSRRSQYGEMAEAIFLTQGFAYPSAEAAEARFIKSGEDEFIYARYGNPTTRTFEERIAALEGTEDAFATASGMAAVSGALTSMLRAGDHVVSARALFGSCLYILEEVLTRYGVKVTFVDGADLDQWRAAITRDTKAVFFESMSNPTLELVDIRSVSDIAHAAGALVVVDNVFATPIFSRAVDQGADVIVYSATKHIDGQGRALGGVVCGTESFIRKTLEPYMKHTGGSMSPFTSWIMLNGMATLDLRCRAMATTAALRQAASVTILAGVRSSQTISTMRRPQAEPMRLWLESTAGIDEAPGRHSPIASAIAVIVEAVPMVMQVPAERAMPPCTPSHSSSVMLPARRSSQYFQASDPDPSDWPA
jgi:O-succinylhomoserine sulfhydrylase